MTGQEDNFQQEVSVCVKNVYENGNGNVCMSLSLAIHHPDPGPVLLFLPFHSREGRALEDEGKSQGRT